MREIRNYLHNLAVASLLVSNENSPRSQIKTLMSEDIRTSIVCR